MLIQSVKHVFERLLGDFKMTLNRMRAIHEHLRLNDRHQVRFLAKRRVTRQRLRVARDACACREFLTDRDHGAPFRKTRAQLPILHQPVA